MISWMLFPQHSHVYRQWLTGAILLRRGWCSDGWSGAWLIADVLLTYETWAGTFIIRTSWGGSLLCFWLSVKGFIFFVWQEQHWFFTAFSYMIGFTPYFLQSLWSCCCLMQTNLSDISVTLIFSVFQSFIGSKWHLCDIIRDVFDQPTLCDKNIWDEEIGACYLCLWWKPYELDHEDGSTRLSSPWCFPAVFSLAPRLQTTVLAT